MNTENKELLLKALCARLPYLENWVQYDGKDYVVSGYGHGRVLLLSSMFSSITGPCPLVEEVKLYLRPMSSMTEEEREELSDYLCERVMSDKSGITFPPDPIHGKGIPFEWMSSCIDWLNEHHFDYCGLIENGLALEAKEGFYKIKK